VAIENTREKENGSGEQQDDAKAKANKPFDDLSMRHLFVQIPPQRFP
jgi:hypothetical protein